MANRIDTTRLVVSIALTVAIGVALIAIGIHRWMAIGLGALLGQLIPGLPSLIRSLRRKQ